MRFFRKIKKAFGLEKQDSFRRWSSSELAEKKFYLECKTPEELTTEDHYMAAEWLIQRYLPESTIPTPDRWAKVIGDIRKKIDSNLIEKASGNFVREELVLTEPYVLTKEDFQQDIVPTFSYFEFFPNPYLKDEQGNEIWDLLFEFTQPYSYKHGEARDALISLCDNYLVERLVQDLSRTYSTLRRAKAEGSLKVKVVCTGKQCPACMTLNETKLVVEELLDSFKNGQPLFPHPLKNEAEIGWCPAPYLSAEIAYREGDDLEFHAELMNIFEK